MKGRGDMMRTWERLWEYMFWSVLNVDGDINGFSTAFSQDCYIMWAYGYRSHAGHLDSLVRDVPIQEKAALIQGLMDEFWEDEPPEMDRYWL